MTAFFLSISFDINASNQDELNRSLLSGMPFINSIDNGLSKKAAPTATSYVSSYFNVSYTCPSGWTITAFDSTPTGFSLTVTKSLMTNIHIQGRKFLTATEAQNYNNRTCFITAKVAYNASNGKMPGIYSIWDTSYISGISSVGINLKYAMDVNNIYQSQCHNASESFSIYQQEYWYFTTISDYSANNVEYSQHWMNLNFYNTTMAKQASSKIPSTQPFEIVNNTLLLTVDQQKSLKLDLFNLIGQKIRNIYNSEIATEKAINLNGAVSASSNYLLKATTPNGSNYYKIFIK
jgi:hypothetical protein